MLTLTALLLCSCGNTPSAETYGKDFTPELSIDTTGHTIHQGWHVLFFAENQINQFQHTFCPFF